MEVKELDVLVLDIADKVVELLLKMGWSKERVAELFSSKKEEKK